MSWSVPRSVFLRFLTQSKYTKFKMNRKFNVVLNCECARVYNASHRVGYVNWLQYPSIINRLNNLGKGLLDLAARNGFILTYAVECHSLLSPQGPLTENYMSRNLDNAKNIFRYFVFICAGMGFEKCEHFYHPLRHLLYCLDMCGTAPYICHYSGGHCFSLNFRSEDFFVKHSVSRSRGIASEMLK